MMSGAVRFLVLEVLVHIIAFGLRSFVHNPWSASFRLDLMMFVIHWKMPGTEPAFLRPGSG